MTVQQGLFTTQPGRDIALVDIAISQCRHSRFNTRKTQGKHAIERLAERITAYGFERTRALWAVQGTDGTVEVFAGGTRLEAARAAGLETVPVLIHEGFTEDEISRRADVDNENDEYHAPVSILDVWAEYARLREEEGWTQERIAKAKGVAQSMVSYRLKLHAMPVQIKNSISQGILTEAHLLEIAALSVDLYFSPWLTTADAWGELAALVAHDTSKNGSKSVRALRDDVKAWKEFIAYAEQAYQVLPVDATLYEMGDPPTPYTDDLRQRFLDELVKRKARSLPKVKAAEHAVRKYHADNLAAYQRWVETQSAEAARQAARAEAEQALLARFVHGDGIQALRVWTRGPIKLLLTDPPYGKDYQSNRRWRSAPPEKVTGDIDRATALMLLKDAIDAVLPHLADDAHVLVFCDAESEPDIRTVLSQAGLTWKGQLIWLKDNHSAGDVEGAFAPDHDCIVHAVKGRPRVSPRYAQTFKVSRSRESGHPTEKPLELLIKLIEATTHEEDIVADPFAGRASTLLAAKRLGRDFWGAEIDATHHEHGATRLLQELQRGQ